jgi:hypothetical protein
VSGCKGRLGSAPDASNGTACAGTTSWSCASSGYSEGANTLYIGCYDVAGNYGTDTVTVTYTIPGGGTTLFTESFEDTGYAARGWYDNTAHGTIVSGGQSGNCLQWAWTATGTTPANGGAMRKAFTATDELYVKLYVKFQTGWRGSQQTYHPHMVTIPSDLDDEYCSLANNYLNTYIELISDVGSPYAIRPSLAIQDSMRSNGANGTPPNDLRSTTENRSAAYCNTPVPTGAAGTCYDATGDGDWYSANVWTDTAHSLTTNAWHLIEAYFKMNTMTDSVANWNGEMKMWVDGVSVISHTDVQYRTNQDATKKWAQFVLSPWIGDGSPITQSMWLDELTVGTTEPYTGVPTLSNLNPTGNQVYATTEVLSLTTSANCNCRYHATETTWAAMGAMSSTGGTTHTQTVSVSPGSNTWNVICQDAEADESAMGTWSFTVASEAASNKCVISLGTGSQSILKTGSQTVNFE